MSPQSDIVLRLMTYKHNILCNPLKVFISLYLSSVSENSLTMNLLLNLGPAYD